MRIVQVHNAYRIPGGEDRVVESEADLLRRRGHEVAQLTRSNSDLRGLSWARLGTGAIWNQAVYRELRGLIRKSRADIVHCHNLFPQISPSVYDAAASCGVPVVQTLHNFRLLCVDSRCFRAGTTCDECLREKTLWPGVLYGCYRDSRMLSALAAGVAGMHWRTGTWRRKVSLYLTLSRFAEQKFLAGGLPEGKLLLKPNFVYPDPGEGSGEGRFALFVGRLSSEKGIDTLVAAWSESNSGVPLRIVGDGELRNQVVAAVEHVAGVEIMGWKSREEVRQLMHDAAFLVFPSLWYENCPMVILEALAAGLPVIGSDLGSTPEMVLDGKTGLLFEPGNPGDLAAKVAQFAGDAALQQRMRRASRELFVSEYSEERGYESLIEAYELAISARRG